MHKNAKPAGRAAISLVVRIGSLVERDDEQGVAHILEHLAFNSTENFTKHKLVEYLESFGCKFGACQNGKLREAQFIPS